MIRTSNSPPPGARRALSARLRVGLRMLLRSDRGVVAFEFVVIVPLMLLVMLGFSEIYLYMRTVSLVEHTAFTLADSLGQMQQVINDPSTSASNNLGSIWNAATLIASPAALKANGGVIVTSICDSASGCAAVTNPTMASGTPMQLWQQSAPWTLSGMKSRETTGNLLPATWPFRNGDSAIVVEVFYNYTPFSMTLPFWTKAPGMQTIYERVYVRPRVAAPFKLAAAS